MPALALVLVTFLVILNFQVFFVGFIASDDGIYVAAARAWSSPVNPLPSHHWGFRYPALWPIAALEHLIDSPPPLAYALLPLAFSIALGTAVVWFVGANIGGRGALAAALLLSTLPLVVVQSSIINVDVIETLFLFLSLAWFVTAARVSAARRTGWLFFSGLALGGALLTRETAYGFLIVYGLLWLSGAWFPRKHYGWVLVGALLVIGAEMGYYVAHGESPLYRFFTIAGSHGTIHLSTADFSSDLGNASDNRWLAPIAALLLNQEFTLLFYAAALALAWLRFENRSTATDARILRVFLFAALVYFVWLGYSGAIRPLPRYFLFAAVVAVIPIALLVQRTRFTGSAMLAVAVLVAANYLALAVENIHPRFAANQVALLADTADQPIVTDPETASRARQIARFRRSPNQGLITVEPPAAPPFVVVSIGGDHNPDAVPLNQGTVGGAAVSRLVQEIEPPQLLIGRLLDLTGLAALLTPSQYRWLAVRNPRVLVFKIDAKPQ